MRLPEIGVASEAAHLGGALAGKPPGPILRPEQRLRSGRPDVGIEPLLPEELLAQIQPQRQPRRAGERERVAFGVVGACDLARRRHLVVHHRGGETIARDKGRGRAVSDGDDGDDVGGVGDRFQRADRPGLDPLGVKRWAVVVHRRGVGPRARRQHAAGVVDQGQLRVGLAHIQDGDGLDQVVGSL